eukprot:4153512-Pleurochrysis_carterae.AAC.3
MCIRDSLEEVDRDAREALARHARVRRKQPQHHRALTQGEGGGRHGDWRLLLARPVVEQHRVRLHVVQHLRRARARRDGPRWCVMVRDVAY